MSRIRRSLHSMRVIVRSMLSVRGWTLINSWTPTLETAMAGGDLPEVSWSQDGEDLIIGALASPVTTYVDVGAHHPSRFSVTKRLYERGWRGVNIDASPGFMALFTAARPEDINIEALVGTPGEATFYRFADPAYSTLDPDRAEELSSRGIPVIATSQVTIHSLGDLLRAHLTPQQIGLLSVDVEGLDLAVLASHDWESYPPHRVLVECRTSGDEEPDPALSVFLEGRGYRLVTLFTRSGLFERMGEPAWENV